MNLGTGSSVGRNDRLVFRSYRRTVQIDHGAAAGVVRDHAALDVYHDALLRSQHKVFDPKIGGSCRTVEDERSARATGARAAVGGIVRSETQLSGIELRVHGVELLERHGIQRGAGTRVGQRDRVLERTVDPNLIVIRLNRKLQTRIRRIVGWLESGNEKHITSVADHPELRTVSRSVCEAEYVRPRRDIDLCIGQVVSQWIGQIEVDDRVSIDILDQHPGRICRPTGALEAYDWPLHNGSNGTVVSFAQIVFQDRVARDIQRQRSGDIQFELRLDLLAKDVAELRITRPLALTEGKRGQHCQHANPPENSERPHNDFLLGNHEDGNPNQLAGYRILNCKRCDR